MARAKKSAAAARTVEQARVTLGRNCGIRESAALRQQLLEQLANPQPVLIDAAGVERIDTAALQLLYAFERDRRAAGLPVQWQGDTAPLTQAAATLGLTLGAPAGPAAGA